MFFNSQERLCQNKRNLSFLFFFAFLAGCGGGRWIDPALQTPPVVVSDGSETGVLEPVDKKEDPSSLKDALSQEESLPEFIPGRSISIKEPPSRTGSLPTLSEERLEKESARLSAKDKKAQKKRSPVTYRGSSLIRELKRLRKRGPKEQLLILQGRARIRHENLTLRSGKITIVGKDGESAISNTPLVIEDKKEKIQIKAGYGKYFRFLRRVILKKNPVMIQTLKNGQKSYLYAGEMIRDFKTGEIVAVGDVKILHETMRGYGERAVYYDRDKKAVLEGNPVVYDQENIYQADQIVYYNEENRVELVGNVQVVLIESAKEPSSEKEGRIGAVIIGDYAEYRFGKDVPMGREVKVTAESKRVVVLREDSEIRCHSLLGRGEGVRELDLVGKVELLELKERTRIYGELGRYWKNEDLVRVLSSGRERPYVVFHNRDDIATGRLNADLLERNQKDEKTYARGDVRVELYRRPKEAAASPYVQVVMFGQWAEVLDEAKVISLRGEPFIEQDPDRIYAREILIFPDENRMELNGSLHGKFSK